MTAYNYLLNIPNPAQNIQDSLSVMAMRKMMQDQQPEQTKPFGDKLVKPVSEPQQRTGNGLLDMISGAEGTTGGRLAEMGYQSDYDVTYGYGQFGDDKSRRLTDMTLGEVFQHQRQMKENQRGNELISSAVGRYQFIEPTLRDLAGQLGISEDTPFTPELQDRLAEQNLKNIGLDEWRSGNLSDEDFQYRLSRQWASIPNPRTGKSYYGQRTGLANEDTQRYLSMYKNKMVGGL